ncbi:MAG TPA: hypothetical protein VFY40_18930 [Blastocatellia bacterium]|nr:hypothetical protein [Blastocatellia bacterium]
MAVVQILFRRFDLEVARITDGGCALATNQPLRRFTVVIDERNVDRIHLIGLLKSWWAKPGRILAPVTDRGQKANDDSLTTARIELFLALLGDLTQRFRVDRRPENRTLFFREQRLAGFVLLIVSEDLPKDRREVIPQPPHFMRRVPERLGRLFLRPAFIGVDLDRPAFVQALSPGRVYTLGSFLFNHWPSLHMLDWQWVKPVEPA